MADPRRGPVGDANGAGFELSDPARSFAGAAMGVLLDPRGFFSRLPLGGAPRNPLVFVLACLLVSALLGGTAAYLVGGWAISPNSLSGMALERGGASRVGMLVLAWSCGRWRRC